MSENTKLVTRSYNYANRVKQVIQMYQDQRGLIHGFQKDAIQNAVGARALVSKWDGWKCAIDVVTNEKGTFLLVTDYGTEGLTGPNLSNDEINKMCDNNDEFPVDWRLARLSCDNVSGGHSTGGGLFGIGKTLYNAASDSIKYIYESLTANYGFRCNINERNKMMPKALENEEGKAYVKDQTGLDPIDHVGTTIIIFNPKKDILDAINDGEMMRDIEETWWRIFPNFKENEGIFLQGKKAQTPEIYNVLPLDTKDTYINDKPCVAKSGYQIKRIGFCIRESVPENFNGFYFYRKGMRIGEINLSSVGMPDEVRDRFFGYVEVDEHWEDELALIENDCHYDVLKEKKNDSTYAVLRDFVRSVVTQKLSDWGYIKTEESRDRKLHEILEQAKNEVQDLFDKAGFEELGKGDSHPSYSVRFQNIVFPYQEPDQRLTVFDKDKISFDYIIKSHCDTKRKYSVKEQVVSDDGSFIDMVDEYVQEIEPNAEYSKHVDFVVSPEKAEKGSRNKYLITVVPASNGRAIPPKKLIFYYAIPTTKNPTEDFDLVMSNRLMPRIADKRVDSGQSISEIVYTMTNNTGLDTKVTLSVSTHNLNDGADKIEDIYRSDYLLKGDRTDTASEEMDVFFDPQVYEQKLTKGKIDIRAKIVCAESNGLYEKGEELSKRSFIVFFNENEKRGIEDEFDVHGVEAEADKRRAWISGHSGSWVISINISHRQYKAIADNDLELKQYSLELIARCFTQIYLNEGKFSSLGLPDNAASQTTHADVFQKVIDKFEETWYQECQKLF